MKLPTALIALTLTITTATAVPSTDPSLAENATQAALQKRARWSVTPFLGRDTCEGAANAFSGTGSQGCTGTGGAFANIIVSDSCTISRWGGDNCFDSIGTAGPGTSGCFLGQVMRSFSVKC